MQTSPPPIYEFGDFRIDASKRLLQRGDGSPVPLTPRVFETLLYMVEHSGEVLERQRLMDAVWPDAFVEENNLTQNISTLRRVLGEGPGSHRFIVTVPGRGYRFVAEVRSAEEMTEAAPLEAAPTNSAAAISQTQSAPEPESIHSPSARKPWLRLATFAVLALGAVVFFIWKSQTERRVAVPAHAPPLLEKSIAVLPFANLSGDPENAYFAEGVKDEILTRLSKVAALKVISRTSTQKFKSGTDDVREIAKQLGVANVLEGSVQRSGDSVRVTVQLINAQSDTHLWAETYDRKLADMFQVESDVAQRVASALEAQLSGAESRALKTRPTVNVAAREAYLKGRYFWNKRTLEGHQKSAEYFQQAIALDPGYARAYAGLSDAYQFLATAGIVSRTELFARARAAAKKAIELDDTLAEPHASLGLIAMNFDWDWATAEKEYRQAIELDPNYATAHHWYAEYLIAVGRADEAAAEIKLARELDPLSLMINTDTGKILYFSRRYPEAIEQLQETLKMDPDFDAAHFWLAHAYATTGRYDEAIAEFGKAKQGPAGIGWLGYVYGVSGRRDEAEKVLRELQRLDREHPVDPHMMLQIPLGLGDKDQTFALLEKNFETRSVGLTSLKVNPWYDSLRSDPRFDDLLRRVDLAR